MNRARRNSLRREKEDHEARRERSSVTNTEATLNKKRSLTANREDINTPRNPSQWNGVAAGEERS